MPIDTAAGLLEALAQHRLLEPAQLDEVKGLRARFRDPRALAKELMGRGWLTPFQVNQILANRAADLVLGNYVMLERIGEGGMGQVFKARHRQLRRLTALKVIHKARLANPDALRRFQREARAAARLKHPHIIQAYELGEDRGTYFFAMEFLEGKDLARLVKERGALPIREACDYIRQAAHGLQHAHEQGLVHRDIKPHNLLVASRGSNGPESPGTHDLKIVDLGLARAAYLPEEEASRTLTQEGSVLGTLDYIAPEQAVNSHQVDIRADLYSLGCTFYYLLTGRVPFPGGEALAKLIHHRFEEPAPIAQFRPEAPANVVGVVGKLMAKLPDDRYQQPADLAAVLEDILAGREPAFSATSVAVGRGLLPAAGANGELAKTVKLDGLTLGPKAKRRRLLFLAGTGVLLLLLCGMLVLLLRGGREHVQQPAPALPPSVTSSIGMKLALIQPGQFLMGSPPTEKGREDDETLHEVEITRPFYLGIHEVTVEQFRAFTQATGYKTEGERGQGAFRFFPDGSWKLDSGIDWQKPGHPQTDNHAVVCVSWNDANAICEWLSKKEGLPYRLPTEAEWEFACRAGSRSPFANEQTLKDVANLADASCRRSHPGVTWATTWDDRHAFPAPVGQFQPNALGLFDLHGNVREWCADWYHKDYYRDSPRQDPPGPAPASFRVVRGGAWTNEPRDCRSASRRYFPAVTRDTNIGFRVLREVPASGGR